MALAPASHVPSIASVSIARVASAPQVKEKQVWVSGCTRTACLFCAKVLSVEGGERHVTPQQDFLLIFFCLSSNLLPQ